MMLVRVHSRPMSALAPFEACPSPGCIEERTQRAHQEILAPVHPAAAAAQPAKAVSGRTPGCWAAPVVGASAG